MKEGEEPLARTDGVAAVDRAFTILGALAESTGSMTLAELARRTGFYKSTLLRLLSSLDRNGYVVRGPSGQYGLGGSAFRLGLAYQKQNPIELHVLPALHELVEQGTESASFHVLHGPETRLCLFRVNSKHSTLDRVAAGDVLPLARGAAGRVLLAFSDPGQTDDEKIRTSGYALSKGERDPSCAGLSAPVLGPSGTIVGAVSLSGPEERFTPTAIDRMRELLLSATGRLTAELGGSR